MEREAHISDQQFQYIARISHGKDSLKMLDVIFTRGLPLDRITTTDIWATDTIRGEHPKMVEFKDRADEYIWQKYRIEVEHLCAMKNGEKVTYEKLFYHVPKRKEKEDSDQAGRQAGRQYIGLPNAMGTVVSVGSQTGSKVDEYRGSQPQSGAGARNSKSTICGFPYQIGPWCQKLKYYWMQSFLLAPPRGAVKIS